MSSIIFPFFNNHGQVKKSGIGFPFFEKILAIDRTAERRDGGRCEMENNVPPESKGRQLFAQGRELWRRVGARA